MWKKMPGGPLTATSFIIGWAMMIAGVFLFVQPDVNFGIPVVTPTTNEFLSDTSPHVYGLWHVLVGFFIAKPGHRYRTLKHMFGAFVFMSWVGVCVWPLFTGSGNPISVIGFIFWTAFAAVIVFDGTSPVYSKHYNPKHYLHD